MSPALPKTTLRTLSVPRILCGVVLITASTFASADEGGVPFWLSGQYASLSAMPATPGWSTVLLPYFADQSASGRQGFARGGVLSGKLDSRFGMLIVQPSYAPDRKLFGGQASVGLGFGLGDASVTGRVEFNIDPGLPDLQGRRTDSVTGGSDLYPIASIAWADGNDNWMVYVTGDIPVGAYDAERLANLGIGHAAIDGGGGYTYLNAKTGLEFSAVAGLTYNWENSDTHYRNGVDSHLDWALSQFLSETWNAGLAGYVYYQLTADDYPTGGVEGQLRKDILGDFKSRVASIGPEVGHLFKVGTQTGYFNVRGYWEFWAKDRVSGYTLFATVSIPFGH